MEPSVIALAYRSHKQLLSSTSAQNRPRTDQNKSSGSTQHHTETAGTPTDVAGPKATRM